MDLRVVVGIEHLTVLINSKTKTLLKNIRKDATVAHGLTIIFVKFND